MVEFRNVAEKWSVPGTDGGVSPEVLEPIGRQLGVADGMLGVLVTEPGLQRPGVVAGIGQRVAAAVPQHDYTELAPDRFKNFWR